MIVFCNGAFKSGSTWLFYIVKAMQGSDPLPKSFAHPLYPVMPRVHKLREFLKTGEHRQRNFVVKSHIYDPRWRDLLLSHQDVYVLNIRRDLKDVLVSHYFHLLRQGTISKSFKKYYWRIGRYKICQMLKYHQTWNQKSPQIFSTEFESLKRDFQHTIFHLAEFLQVKLKPQDTTRIQDATSLKKMRQEWREEEEEESRRFFRGGRIGEWRQHFDEQIYEDLQQIIDQGLHGLDLFIYYLLFEVRHRIKSTITERHEVFTRLLRRV